MVDSHRPGPLVLVWSAAVQRSCRRLACVVGSAMDHADDAMSTCHATPVPVPLVHKAASPTGAHSPGHIAPTLYASPRCASHQDHLPLLLRSAHAPVPGATSRSAVAGQALTPERPPPSSAKPWKEGGKQTEGQAAAAEPPPSRSAAIGSAPVRGGWGREEAVHGQSTAAPVPTAVPPWGGGEEREGAASVRARCRADGGQEWRLAAQQCAGAVQWREGVQLSV